MQIDLRPRTLAENLSLTFQLAGRHFAPLFLLFAVLSLPQLYFEILETQSTTDARHIYALGGLLLATLFAGPIAAGAAVAIVAGSFTGDRMSFGRALKIGLDRFGPMLVFAMVTGLFIFAGFLLLIVPGLMLLTRYFVGTCSVVLERRSAGAAMARSAKLSDGKRMEIFALWSIVTLITGAAAAIVTVPAALFLVGSPTDTSLPFTVIAWLVQVAAGILAVVAPVTMYFSLRCEKDALDVQQLAALVDEIGARRAAD